MLPTLFNLRAVFKTTLSIIIVAALSSCQKEISYSVPPSPVPASGSNTSSTNSRDKVKTYTEDITTPAGHTTATFNLTYDANDRILSMVSAASPGDKFVYQYNTNNTYTMDLYNSNSISIHSLFFINSMGLVDSAFKYNDTKDTSTEKYIYNSSKQLIAYKEFDYTTAGGPVLYDSHAYTYDSNGNVSKDIDASGTVTYDYTTSTDNIYLGNVYLAQQSKLLPKTTTYSSQGTVEILNHSYTFDSANRVSTEKMVGSSGETIIKTYTYY